MSRPELKTSYDWIMDAQFAGLVLLDADGWPRDPDKFDFAFYEELIPRSEFEKRIMDSTIEWSLPKL